MDVIYFLKSICKEKICLYPETVPSSRQRFKEGFWEGQLVKNFEIFSMNNKTIIEFGFCLIKVWWIMQISENVIHLGLGV